MKATTGSAQHVCYLFANCRSSKFGSDSVWAKGNCAAVFRPVTALHLASARSGAEEFVEVALTVINRDAQGIWDFQDIANRAVVDRPQRDVKVVRHFKDRLHSNPTESESASLPRYLMAAGASDDGVHERCRSLLQDEARHPLPRPGYDAVDDSTRAVSRSHLEVLAPSFSP